jgi:ribosomal protein S18 acetylase RimI-like enzyme
MSDINLRLATPDDVAILAEMNKQLIIDERSRNQMTHEELENRFRTWFDDGRTAILVTRGAEIIGYLLYYAYDEEYFPYKTSVYIRQFFIQPSYRRRGIGQNVFERIAEEFFPEDYSLMLDVREANPDAKAFWLKLGFTVHYTTLRRDCCPE